MRIAIWTLAFVAAAATASAQNADRDVEKAFEVLMKKAAPPKDANEAARKAAGDEFRAALAEFLARFEPQAAALGPGLRPLARAELLAGKPAAAVPLLERFVATQAGHEDHDEARLDLGAAYLDVGSADKALATYEAFLKDRPASDLATAARFYAGVAAIELGRLDDGVASLDLVAKTGPDHPLAADAGLKAVRALAEAGRIDAAKERLAALLREAPQGEALLSLKEELERIGAPAPELDGVRTWLGAGPVSLAKKKGEVVVLCFFADLYEASRAELAALARLEREYAGKPVSFVALTTYYRRKSMSEDQEDAFLRRLAAEQSWTTTIGVVKDFSLLRAYGVRGVPHVVVVDRDGRVAHLKVGAGRADRRGAAALENALRRAVAATESRPAK